MNWSSSKSNVDKSQYTYLLSGAARARLRSRARSLWRSILRISLSSFVSSFRSANMICMRCRKEKYRMNNNMKMSLPPPPADGAMPDFLIPARSSRAFWANALRCSSFFSFSFCAIFFSTWALTSTASRAWNYKHDYSNEIVLTLSLQVTMNRKRQHL